jgi:hypothetical protein
MRKSKLFVFLSILTLIFILGTGALTDQCTMLSGLKADEQENVKDELDEIVEEEKEEAEEEEEPSEEATEKETDTGEEKETADESAKDGEGIEPTISLKIYQDATYSAADDVCYYRIQANVKGDPSPDIIWSEDESKGSFGNKIAQVNLNRGETYELTATATNTAGSATSSMTLSWKCDGEEVADTDGDENQSEEEMVLRDYGIPVVNDIIFSTDLVIVGQKVDVTAIASDPDGGGLTYHWEATDGSIVDVHTNPMNWTAPDTPVNCTVWVVVEDQDGDTNALSKQVNVISGTVNLQAYGHISGIIFCDGGVQDPEYGWTKIGDTDYNEVILTYISFIGIIPSFECVTITDASLIMDVYQWIGHPELAGNQIVVQAVDYGDSLGNEDQNFGVGMRLGTINNPSSGLHHINFTSPELIDEIERVMDDPVRHYVQLRLYPDGVNWNSFSDYYKIMYQTVYLHIEYECTATP